MDTLTDECFNIINKFTGNYNIINTKELKKLYNLFEDNYENNTIKYNIQNVDIKENDIIVNNPYISINIINDIKTFKKYTYVHFKIFNNNIKLHIYHNEINLDNFIDKILIYIKFMYKITNYKNDLSIKYYLTNCKKKIKKKNRNHIFTTDEINTGSSSIKEINIWRKEEVLKTTIHELIHYMSLDYRNDTNDIIEYYKKSYRCSSNIMNTFEGYTDFWAIIINIYLCSKILNNIFEFFKKMLEIEISFTIYQCHKILYLSRKKNDALVDFNKNTNIISYYFIKYSLFESIGKSKKCIIKYILNNNINLFIIKDLNDYFNYLQKLKIINSNNKRFNKSMIESMRMSVCDIKLF